jgi:hypothetical protein
MSSDKTETEASRDSLKVLRRLDRPWCDTSLCWLWEAIEDYNHIMMKREQRDKLGNPGLRRLQPLATNPVSTGAVMHFLPKNFYRPTWWFSQHEHVQFALHSKEDQPIPDYSQ